MATTINQIVDQIMRLIAGGDVSGDFPWDEREIKIAVGQARDGLIARDLFKNMQMGEKTVSPELLSVYRDQEIKYDTGLALYYTDLPAKYITLPHDKGLWHVSFMQDQVATFKRVPNGGNSVFANLPGGDLSGNIGFWVEGDRIYYVNYDSSLDACKVLIKMVAKTNDIDMDDPLPITSDMETEIVEYVYKLYLERDRGPKDRITDSEDANT